MKQSICIEVDDCTIGVVRNPYERVITLYRESWDWIGLEDWVRRTNIQLQSDVYKDCHAVVCLETWEADFKALGITPDKKSMELLYKKYSTDYKRWYGTNLLNIISPIVQQDLDTYGYRF